MTSFDGYVPDKPGCELKTWPKPPKSAEPGSPNTLTGATRALRFGADTAGNSPGFDLDGLCTCPDRGSCTTKAGSGGRCDSPNGVDNTGASILALLFGSEKLLEGIEHGLHGLFVQIDEYNLQASDRKVSVSLFNVVGVNGKTDGTGSATFTGNDEFIMDTESMAFEAQPGSKYVDINAYVTDGTLVAQFNSFPLRMVFDPADGDPKVAVVQPFESLHLVGRVAHDGHGGLQLQGATLSGRIAIANMFLQAGPASICAKDSRFGNIKETVCNAVDLHTGGNESAPCDAISFALELDVLPAKRRVAPALGFRDPPCPPPEGGVHCD
ncbi:hypothetical protein [Pendulispora albinea]|uniref:Root cap family protein n=1 Tax=Pendulispora albinea TaxID=2741071 RepID=A0ABZ2LQ41_9BACT